MISKFAKRTDEKSVVKNPEKYPSDHGNNRFSRINGSQIL